MYFITLESFKLTEKLLGIFTEYFHQVSCRFVKDLQRNHVKVVNFEFSMTDPPLYDTPHPLWIS